MLELQALIEFGLLIAAYTTLGVIATKLASEMWDFLAMMLVCLLLLAAFGTVGYLTNSADEQVVTALGKIWFPETFSGPASEGNFWVFSALESLSTGFGIFAGRTFTAENVGRFLRKHENMATIASVAIATLSAVAICGSVTWPAITHLLSPLLGTKGAVIVGLVITFACGAIFFCAIGLTLMSLYGKYAKPQTVFA